MSIWNVSDNDPVKQAGVTSLRRAARPGHPRARRRRNPWSPAVRCA